VTQLLAGGAILAIVVLVLFLLPLVVRGGVQLVRGARHQLNESKEFIDKEFKS
jgi:hypothetical protein